MAIDLRVPKLEPGCGSWICTSPTGEMREFFTIRNVVKALDAGWKAESAMQYLVRFANTVKAAT